MDDQKLCVVNVHSSLNKVKDFKVTDSGSLN